jgi:hypothetical protein
VLDIDNWFLNANVKEEEPQGFHAMPPPLTKQEEADPEEWEAKYAVDAFRVGNVCPRRVRISSYAHCCPCSSHGSWYDWRMLLTGCSANGVRRTTAVTRTYAPTPCTSTTAISSSR